MEEVLNVQVLHSGHSQRRASCTRLPFTFHGGPSGSEKEGSHLNMTFMSSVPLCGYAIRICLHIEILTYNLV